MSRPQSPYQNQWGEPANCARLVPRDNESRFRYQRQQIDQYTLAWEETQGSIRYPVFEVCLSHNSTGARNCWEIKSIHTGRTLFTLDFVKFLSGETWPDADLYQETVEQLANQYDAKPSYRSYLRWVPPTIEALYHPSRSDLAHEFTWATKRAKLCALFLTWLDELRIDRGRFETVRFGLLCLYHQALAYLYERESEWREEFLNGSSSDWHLDWEYRKIRGKWYQICQDPDNRSYFDTHLHADQAQAMLDLIVYQDNDKCRLRRFVRETPAGQTFAFDRVARWFLRHYDVPTAERIHNALSSLSFTSDDAGPGTLQSNTVRQRIAWHAGFIIATLLILATTLGALGSTDVALGLMWFTTGITYPILILLGLFVWKQPRYLRLTSPRLIGGLIVGYATLLLANDAWSAIHELLGASSITSAGLIRWTSLVLGALALAAVGLWARIGSTRQDKPVPWRNVPAWLYRRPARYSFWLLSARTLSLSILGSVVMVDLMADVYLDKVAAQPAPPLSFPGVFGKMYPFLAIAFAALALFVATFVQLLWEDQPLTEPWN